MPSTKAEKLSLGAKSSFCEEETGGAPGTTCLLPDLEDAECSFSVSGNWLPHCTIPNASCLNPSLPETSQRPTLLSSWPGSLSEVHGNVCRWLDCLIDEDDLNFNWSHSTVWIWPASPVLCFSLCVFLCLPHPQPLLLDEMIFDFDFAFISTSVDLFPFPLNN